MIVTGLTTAGLVYLYAAGALSMDLSRDGVSTRTAALCGLFWPVVFLWALVVRLVG